MLGTGLNSHSFKRKRGPFRVIAFITLWSFLFSMGGGNYLVENAWAARAVPESASPGSVGLAAQFLLRSLM